MDQPKSGAAAPTLFDDAASETSATVSAAKKAGKVDEAGTRAKPAQAAAAKNAAPKTPAAKTATKTAAVAKHKPSASADDAMDAALHAVEESAAAESAAPERAKTPAAAGGRRATAQELATKQREISVSEFFTKNRHLLGFDSPLKALMTTVKEAVDNSLDACEEAGILPEITVEITKTGEDRYRVAVEDNGPGIVPEQIGKVFGKLLYGSKFHKLSQTRGQQGIGISAAGMYGQLTTGLPVRIVSRTSKKGPAHEYQLSIDTVRNKPDIHESRTLEWHQDHGTRVEIEMEARYQRGDKSVDMYLKQTAIANPHLTLHYKDPTVGAAVAANANAANGEAAAPVENTAQVVTYERVTKHLPPEAIEIKPHPHGVELGRLIGMLKETESRTLSAFLQDEFVRVGPKVVDDICTRAKVSAKAHPPRIAREEAAALHTAIQSAKIMSPPTTCLSPIGEELILAGLKKEIEADFYTATTRPAAVYRGNPFQIEAGIAYGKPGGVGLELTVEGRIQKKKSVAVTEDLVGNADDPIRVLRFANRVPLLYQQGGCAITRAVLETNWKNYGLQQPKGGLPIGACAVFIHIASVWVPFTSESKEAIANYAEIVDEIQLALRECGRQLGIYVRKGKRLQSEFNKRSYIETYIPHIGIALQEILDLSDGERDATVHTLDDVLQRSRKV